MLHRATNMPCERCTSRPVARLASAAAFLLAIFAVATVWRAAHAQPGDAAPEQNEAPIEAASGEDGPGRSSETAGDNLFVGAARLNVDYERERLMARAERYAAAGQIEPALARWQQMLDEPRTRIYSGRVTLRETFDVHKSAERIAYGRYHALGHEIERLIVSSPPGVLRSYREMVDPEARALLRDSRADRREALARLVHRYFLSSLGDVAAYELAALRFDRGEMPAAARLLARILDDYPRSAIPREKVLFRLALAEARMGHALAARRRMDELSQIPATHVSAELRALAEQEIAEAERARQSNRGGGLSAGSLFAGPPPELFDVPLTEEWVASRSPRPESAAGQVETLVISAAQQNIVALRQGIAAKPTVVARTAVDQELARDWRRNGWTPAVAPIIDGGRLYFAGDVDLVCIELATGRVIWRSEREYHYEHGVLAQRFSHQLTGEGRQPQSPAEARLFGDRVHQAMSLAAGRIYVLEGIPADVGTRPDDHADPSSAGIARRLRQNWLTCYDARTGKLRWTRRAADEEVAIRDMCFLGPPTADGERLFVPVSDRGDVWLHALDARSGTTLWRRLLCDEPPGCASPWSPAAVVCAGSDVYVCAGTGVVFALEASSGDVHWAVRYQRSGKIKPGALQRGRIGNFVREIVGWNDDVLIPYEGRLIVLASDYDRLFALDRRSGELLWDSPRAPVRDDPRPAWLLGLLDGGMFVAGPNVVCRYDAAGGRLIWQRRIEGATGRGFVSREGVYLPLDDAIVRLDPRTGDVTHRTGFVSPSSEPLGNLHTDGERLLVAAPGRIYSVVGLDQRMDALAETIDRGDGRAQLERMRLRRKLGDIDAAIDDLRGGWKRLLQREEPSAALAALLDGIGELNLAAERPRLTLELVVEAAEVARDAEGATPGAKGDATAGSAVGDRARSARETFERKAAGIIHAALGSIERHRPADGAAAILAAASVLDSDRLMVTAQRAIAAAATADDAPLLLETLAGDDPVRRAIAVAGLSAALGADALDQFVLLIEDPQEDVRLAAAVALANHGDRRSLRPLVALLESSRLSTRAKSIQTLRRLTGRRTAYMAYDPAGRRRAAVREWEEWLMEQGDAAELHSLADVASQMHGRTLIGLLNHSVIEVNADGEQVWRIEVQSPYGCEGLPNGHRLVTSFSTRSVIEYDAQGREVWKLSDVPGAPYNARRLPNGNTLVACSSSDLVIEFNSEKQEVWRASFSRGRPIDAHRLDNGNTLVSLQTQNSVVEVDHSGRTVWKLENTGRQMGIQPLENGNVLVCHAQEGRVVEWDREGNEVRVFGSLRQPMSAQRLPGGNTLIAGQQGVAEFSPAGEIVWKRYGLPASSVHRY